MNKEYRQRILRLVDRQAAPLEETILVDLATGFQRALRIVGKLTSSSFARDEEYRVRERRNSHGET